MRKTIAVVGTIDTKLEEFTYLVNEIKKFDVDTLVIDVSMRESHNALADISNDQVAKMGGSSIEEISKLLRNEASMIMYDGIRNLINKLYAEDKIHAFISMGGSGGTSLANAAIADLPLGFPKLIVSTMAGITSPRTLKTMTITDMLSMNPIVDISGINSITKHIFSQAAGAIAGACIASLGKSAEKKKLTIAATMYGLTTPCVVKAKEYLENLGYEVITFHCTGMGGRAMEKLVENGFFDGMLDITNTEVHSHIMDTVSTAGEKRCAMATKKGIPQILCLGAMDMVGANDFTNFQDRKFYCHNRPDKPTHIRPNVSDEEIAGKYLADKLNEASTDTYVFMPHGGFSDVDKPGKPTYDKDADEALINSLKTNVKNDYVHLIDMEENINDESFALAVAKKMDELMKAKYER